MPTHSPCYTVVGNEIPKKITQDCTNGRCSPQSPVLCRSILNIYNSAACTNSRIDTVVDHTPAFQHPTAGRRVILRNFIGQNRVTEPCMYRHIGKVCELHFTVMHFWLCFSTRLRCRIQCGWVNISFFKFIYIYLLPLHYHPVLLVYVYIEDAR